MKFVDLEVDSIFSCGDDAVYKCIYITNNYAALLQYSLSHNVCTIEFCDKDSDMFDSMTIITDKSELSWMQCIFDSLEYYSYDTLKPNL